MSMPPTGAGEVGVMTAVTGKVGFMGVYHCVEGFPSVSIAAV